MQRDELNKLVFNQNRSLQRAWKACYKLMGDDISMGQLGILFYVKSLQPVSGKAIAEHMRISRSAVTQLIDGLHAKGFIDRREDPSDRRISYLSLADKGVEYLQRFDEKGLAFFENVTQVLTAEELAELSRIQAKMLAEFDIRLAEL